MQRVTPFRMLETLKAMPKPSHFIIEVFAEHEPLLADLQREQLQAGKGIDGNNLPTYREDVGKYFKSIESADRYAAWKATISPNKSKPKDVRDYWIDGTFQKSIYAEVKEGKLTVYSNSEIYPDVVRATENKGIGLSKEIIASFLNEIAIPEAQKRYKEALQKHNNK